MRNVNRNDSRYRNMKRADCVIERADRINKGTDGRARACSSRIQRNDQRIVSNENNVRNKEYRNPVHIKNSRAQKKYKSKNNLVRFLLATAVVAATVCLILVSNKKVVSADESGKAPQLNKYYKSITIEPGDTLWSIAEEYKSGAYKTTKDYVEELMDMNDVHSGRITSGQKLVVAYYAE